MDADKKSEDAMKKQVIIKGSKGFVMIVTLAVVLLLSTMSFFAIQHTGFSLYLSATQRDNSLLDSTAQACLDIIIDRCRGAKGLNGLLSSAASPFKTMGLPRPFGTETMPIFNNPIIGDAVGFADCVDGGPSPDCVCRTGYLYDFDGNFFKYNLGNTRHTAEDIIPDHDDGSSGLRTIMRYGQKVGHAYWCSADSIGGKTDDKDDTIGYDRYYVWLSVAVNNSVREYRAILEGDSPPKQK